MGHNPFNSVAHDPWIHLGPIHLYKSNPKVSKPTVKSLGEQDGLELCDIGRQEQDRQQL